MDKVFNLMSTAALDSIVKDLPTLAFQGSVQQLLDKKDDMESQNLVCDMLGKSVYYSYTVIQYTVCRYTLV